MVVVAVAVKGAVQMRKKRGSLAIVTVDTRRSKSVKGFLPSCVRDKQVHA